ncbi:MAG: membrane protein insertase YidC [Betaproteobacteria bacterium]|nr:MAG: membrane protein insertase YidC [Betaproteobacteria bacterium]
MDTQRLILFFVFSFSLLLLWDAWQKEQRPAASLPAPAAKTQNGVPSPARPIGSATPPAEPAQTGLPSVPTAAISASGGERIQVQTDLLVAEIDTLGGSLRRVELLKHKGSEDTSKNFVLLQPERHYAAQSGLTGESGPNHRTLWVAIPGERQLQAGQDSLQVRLMAEGSDGIRVEKTYTFRRDSYLVEVAMEVRNGGQAPVATNAYFQLTHDGKEPTQGNAVAGSFGAQSFVGFAYFTSERKYGKVQFADLDKGKADYPRQAQDGWIAFVQHYFVAAWIPAANLGREFVIERRQDGSYAGRAVLPVGTLGPGAASRIAVPLYVGPQEQRRLEAASASLPLVVDYGWLTVIAQPLFWLLEMLHGLSGNWGVAIILLTVLIKLLFFPLSAASYKSMAKMKLITPRLTKIREMYAHDRTKMNQAMMELYKTEKINPLGGCFPILVQIPVFIALYWVLLAAIELRHAPFVLWIRDLSALDPYYVLPVLMTITMVLQTRMNPTPPDPVQAKVMQFMPYVFSVFFFFFPAGLVLYWLVNNILSILQQWQIQRMFDRDRPAHAKR